MSRYINTAIEQPRSYIYSSNADAVILESVLPETNLLFLTRDGDTGSNNPPIVLSASNNQLIFYAENQNLIQFGIEDNVPFANLDGDIYAKTLLLTELLKIDLPSNDQDVFVEFRKEGSVWSLYGASNETGQVGLQWAPSTDSHFSIQNQERSNLFVVHASNVDSYVNVNAPMKIGALAIPRGILDVVGDTYVDGHLKITPSDNRDHIVLSDGVANIGRRMIVLQDNNPASVNQFAGFGVDNGRIIYQSPSALIPHSFYTATSANASQELMRIGADTYGNATVGIGIASLLSSNVALQVGGNTVIHGNLDLRGNFLVDYSRLGVVQLDSNTHTVPYNLLPDGLVYIGSNNQLDASLIPSNLTANLFRSSANVGLGTKLALQKLHVIGSGIYSERLGIGTNVPISKLHVHAEAGANCPAVQIDQFGACTGLLIQNASGPILKTFGDGSVGIGTTEVMPGMKFSVKGKAHIDSLTTNDLLAQGDLSMNTISVGPTDAKTFYIDRQTIEGTPDIPVYRFQSPVQVHSSFATETIEGVDGIANIRFKNTAITVDNGGTFTATSPSTYALVVNGKAAFTLPPVILSDGTEKTNIVPISNPHERIMQLHGYTYQMPQYDLSRVRAGLLAQEVFAAMPEAVDTLPDGRMAVSYDSVLALMVEGYCDIYRKLERLSKVFSFKG